MVDLTPADHAALLLDSPAGTALLMLAEENGLSPADLTRPEIALFAIAQAVGQISPWHGHGHHRIRRRLDDWRHEHRLHLERLALQIVSQPGIDWWWGGVDRQHQVWLPQHDTFICPEEVWELRPRDAPNRFECYVHEPRPLVSTSNAHGDLSPELAHVLSGVGDWDIQTPFIPRHVTIRPSARIREILSAQDWHDFVRQYPANSYHPSSPENYPDQPWGDAPGLMVPNWRAVSFDYDGVHISPWTYLVANQVRVTSDIGWTEPWAWEGPHTVWLDWMFATVEDLPPVLEDARDHVLHWSAQELNFSDPRGWQMMPQNIASRFLAIHQPGYEPTMTNRVTREPFGEIDGQPVEKITLANDLGMSISILTYGGIIQTLRVPDRHGVFGNVVLGFDTLDDYVVKSPYFGAIVGRYANRIAHGRFELDGVTYNVPVNNGEHSLHGGIGGFDRQVWRAETIESEQQIALRLSYVSADGEEGYPGQLNTTVQYDLNPTSLQLRISYHGTTDAPTVLNLSNHSYFNLAGEGNGTILQHVAELRASRYLPVDAGLIPTGELAPVAGTPFDFTEAHVIGERIDRPGDEQLAIAGGYDHCWVLDTVDDLGFDPSWNIRVVDPGSGRVMDVKTDQPGVQFYSGNFLDGSFAGTSGQVYPQRAGFCLETQHFPDSPNQPQFPSTILRPGEEFHSRTSFSFGVQ